jgi:endonuclease-3
MPKHKRPSRKGEKAERKERARKMARVLRTVFPEAKSQLKYRAPWELVVAVILSAQTMDKKVNEVTRTLFKKYRSVSDYANASATSLARDVYPVSFYTTKAKNIIAAATLLESGYRGKIPKSIDELIRLPGVGRKTANVILGNLYDINEGIMVDTHVRRLAQKFNLSEHTDPGKIERDLMELVPQKQWYEFGQRLVMYGQQVCPARKHDCEEHPLTKIYPKAAHTWPKAH